MKFIEFYQVINDICCKLLSMLHTVRITFPTVNLLSIVLVENWRSYHKVANLKEMQKSNLSIDE
jgi:hypothetical protein